MKNFHKHLTLFTAVCATLFLLAACGGTVKYKEDGGADSGPGDAKVDSASNLDGMPKVDSVISDQAPGVDKAADKSTADQLMADKGIDQSLPDQKLPDQSIPDQVVPDQAIPDQAVPDQTIPDQAVPDQAIADQSVPDHVISDKSIPDQTDTVLPTCGWAVSGGGTQNDGAHYIEADNTGNTVMVGTVAGPATLGSVAISGAGMYVAKVNPQGKYLWVTSSVGADRGYSSIAVDSQGNSYVLGWFKKSLTLGTTTLTSNGGADIFLAKLDSGGTFKWAKNIGGLGDDGGFILTADKSNNIYITGHYVGPVQFGSKSMTGTGIFVGKLDSDGKPIWVTPTAEGTSLGYSGIAVDNSGNSVVSGYFYGGAKSFGTHTVTSTGAYEIFVAKLDNIGKFLWAKSAGGSGYDLAYGNALDSAGNSFLTGRFEATAKFGSTSLSSAGGYDVFVTKLDGSGNFLWAKSAGGSGKEDYGHRITVDNMGNCLVTGYYEDTANFGSTQHKSLGARDVFVTKLDTFGKFLWTASAGGTGVEYGYGVSSDSAGNIIVTGTFQGTATFGSTPLVSKGGGDLFVWKLCNKGPTYKMVQDDTFADFSQGTLSESGAKIYASAKGNVQMLDRLDLNGDGHLDMVASNHWSGSGNYLINSYIYWNSSTGFSSTSKTELPTVGAKGVSVADLDADGHPDIVFSNGYNNVTKSAKVNSFIYWGPFKGVSPHTKTELPTIGAIANAVADINHDGYLDIVFANQSDGVSSMVNSYIYWGSAGGYSATATSREKIPTLGARGISVADLDKDGDIDLAFANMSDGTSYKINSYVYYGPSFLTKKPTELPTMAATDVSAADLDKDGRLDLVFSNAKDSVSGSYDINSYIYWNSSTGFSSTSKTELPTRGARSTSTADLDGDGCLDVVFSNAHNGWIKVFSYLYKGDCARGFPVSTRKQIYQGNCHSDLVADFNGDLLLDLVLVEHLDKTPLSNFFILNGSTFTTKTALPIMRGVVQATDPGSVYSRKGIQTFTSRILDTGVSTPTYGSLSWTAKLPTNTSLKFQIRSSNTNAGISSATWYGPTTTLDYYVASSSVTSKSLNPVHNGHRYIQYRATLGTVDFGNTPVLDKVQVSFY